MKYLAILTVFCLSLLVACTQNTPTVQEENLEPSMPNPSITSSEPIHAVGGAIEEDPETINHQLSVVATAMTPEQVIKLYYPHESEQEKEVITITKEQLENDQVKVTLVDDNMADDSQKTTKIEMTLEPVGKAWKVLKIEKQWKCYDGRGHTDWGIQSCN